jgi:hypothetical protein
MICQLLCSGRNSILCPSGFVAAAIISVFGLVSSSHADTVIFGSGANSFSMEFVTIGNPGNVADTTGDPNPAGSVGYTYSMGKFEVSEDMIDKFNASQSLQITKDTRGVNKAATSISWNEAARFVNWLNTSTGNAAAYKFADGTGVNDNILLWQSGDAGYDPSNPYRNSMAKYFLPSYNEWYKAAYYDPTSGVYYDFPTGSDTAPTPVISGTDANTAVYFGKPVADVNQAGGLSPYGVMGLAGNVEEWEESSFDLLNNSAASIRATRGGYMNSATDQMLSYKRLWGTLPTTQLDRLGFRVASLSLSSPLPAQVPEPGSLVIGALVGLGGLVAKRRKKK